MAARALSPYFARVVAVDPSEGMVAQARRQQPQPSKSDTGSGGGSASNTSRSNVEFYVAPAEDLSSLGLADGSVTLATAAQAAHWFDRDAVWRELARVVAREGGAVAFFGYADNVLVGRPAATRVFDRYTVHRGEVVRNAVDGITGPFEGLGGLWEEPGRTRLREGLRELLPPMDGAEWTDIRRVVFMPNRDAADGTGELVRDGVPVADDAYGAAREGQQDDERDVWSGRWLRRTMKLGEFEGYIRTYSAFRTWRDAHPEFRSRAEEQADQGGSSKGVGDIIDWMFDDMRDVEPDWKALGDNWRDAELDCLWNTSLVLARRR